MRSLFAWRFLHALRRLSEYEDDSESHPRLGVPDPLRHRRGVDVRTEQLSDMSVAKIMESHTRDLGGLRSSVKRSVIFDGGIALTPLALPLST